MKILLIEDDPTDRKLFSVLLQSNGHHVLEKNSAEEAVMEAASLQPELILLDLKLPGMDGLKLTRRLKADPDTKHIPITAARESHSRDAALAAGCDAYIIKPVDTRKLNAQIVSAGGKKGGSPGKEP